MTRSITFKVAGVQHRPDFPTFASLPIGPDSTIELIDQPDNVYDSDAIRVIIHGKDVGYIPRPINTCLQLLREYYHYTIAFSFNPDAKPYDMFIVTLTFTPLS